MDRDQMILDIEQILEDITVDTQFNGADYRALRKQCARLHLDKGGYENELEAIHHLTEAHAAALRQLGMEERLRTSRKDDFENCLSFRNGIYVQSGRDGVLKRLKEMPSEWTIVQLTREFDPMDQVIFRREGQGPKLKNFHLVRLPCGQEKSEVPFVIDCSWPNERCPIAVFCRVKAKWKDESGPQRLVKKKRKESSEEAENYCSDLVDVGFNEWKVALLGKLQDTLLQAKIRKQLDLFFETRCPDIKVSPRQRYLVYLIAEGSSVLSKKQIHLGVAKVFPGINMESQLDFVHEIVKIKNCFKELATSRRLPVILILDDQLDVIPWESSIQLKEHPYSRMPSLHFVHLGYKIHRGAMKQGLMEVLENEVCFYIINPGNNLPLEQLEKFLKLRCPSWEGVINQVPSKSQIIDAFSKYKLFMYCGHGNGSQYFSSESLMDLEIIQGLQLFFGCSSGALVDHGRDNENTGEILSYIVAGSGCTVGMLWSITTSDADAMTAELINCLFSGAQVNFQTLKKIDSPREAELLRALPHVRKAANVFSNGAALIARGLPMKIAPKKTHS